MPDNFVWIALAICGLVTGAGIVGLLVLPQLMTPVPALACLASFAASVWLFGEISGEYQTVAGPLAAFVIMLAAVACGYALASTLLERLDRPNRVVTLPSPTGSDTALIVLACAEPESYAPTLVAAELAELAEEGTVELGIGVTPFIFAAQKARYRAAGGKSPSRRQVGELVERLESSIDRTLYRRLDVAWCSGPGTLTERVAAASSAGCSRVVVLPLAVAESLEMHHAKQALDRAHPMDAGICVAYGAPLHGSEDIARLIARRIGAGIGNPATTGVALVAHAQPEAREQECSGFDVGETAFVNRVRMMVSEHGVPDQQIRVAWAEWREPGVSSTVRHLAALGCERILVSPACFPFESTVTRIDIPMGVKLARIDPMISVVTLSVWRDDPEVLDALKASAADALGELAEADGRQPGKSR